MRLIDADELMEHVFNDKLDSRELIAQMVANAPTVTNIEEAQMMCKELRAHVEYLQRENGIMRGKIDALAFAVRCLGISWKEVRYEVD